MTQLAANALVAFNASNKVVGQIVSYKRRQPPSVGDIDLPANLGKSKLVIEDAGGMRVEAVSHDFIVRVDDLVLSGKAFIPREGDRILATIGNSANVYEVMTPPYDPSDSAGALLRIHTKLISRQ